MLRNITLRVAVARRTRRARPGGGNLAEHQHPLAEFTATRHDLLTYETDAELVERVVPFLTEGVALGDATLVVTRPADLTLLREALGDTADEVQFIDCDGHYTRPEAAIATYDATLRSLVQEGVERVRLFGELPACTTPEARDGWIRYEALLNVAFRRHPAWILCGYNASALETELLAGALRTHDHVLGEVRRPNPGYQEPSSVVAQLAPAPEAVPELHELEIGEGATTLRAGLCRSLREAGVTQWVADGMLLAAQEILANALTHGGGSATVRIGGDTERFVCEISDHGPGLDDPMAGHLPPDPGADEGSGLWVARQATRRLDLLPTSGGGLTVRLWV
jgi:anti-sigma regulatory factor (Ser/Thr protein kinase)